MKHPLSQAHREYIALFGEDDLWIEANTEFLHQATTNPASTPSSNTILPIGTNPALPQKKEILPTPIKSVAKDKLTYLDSASLQRLQKSLSSPEEQGGAAASIESMLDALRQEYEGCHRCRLFENRNSIVFGEGLGVSKLMFVGEAPGVDEDEQGKPFVGRSGRLLTDIIEKGMRLARSEVYIANIVKCRPPQNRNPQPDEVEKCKEILLRQIAILQPKWVVTLGGYASQVLLNTEKPIEQLKGQWHQLDLEGTATIQVMPTWHPRYLLRTPAAKKETWEHIQSVMRAMKEVLQ